MKKNLIKLVSALLLALVVVTVPTEITTEPEIETLSDFREDIFYDGPILLGTSPSTSSQQTK